MDPRAAEYLKRAEELMVSGDFNNALEKAKGAEQVSPNDYQILFFKASLQDRLGHLEEALKTFETLVSNHPNDFNARLSLAVIAAKAGLFQKAFDLAKLLEGEEPENVSVHQILATGAFGLNNFKEAAVHMTHLVRLEPDNDEYRKELTRALIIIQYFEKACDTYRPLFEKQSDSSEKFQFFGDICTSAGRIVEAISVLKSNQDTRQPPRKVG